MRMSTRFYPSILGAAFAQLPAAVRAAHATATLMRGTVSVERGTSWLARLAAWLAGFPAPCVDAPCSVAFEVYGAGERWRRDMNGSIYVSTLTPAPEAACFDERFPLYSFRFRIEADAQGARFVLLRHHVCGIPVPRRFWPRVTTYESEENGRYAFAVEARTFRDQMLVRYSGVLLPVRVERMQISVHQQAGYPGCHASRLENTLTNRELGGMPRVAVAAFESNVATTATKATKTTKAATSQPGVRPTNARISERDTQEYFEQVAHDYRAWSPDYNMHFGYWRVGINPLKREEMLVQLNREIGMRLGLQPGTPAVAVDFGCGAGGTSRTLAAQYQALKVLAVSNVAVQHRIAAEHNRRAGVAARITQVEADFRRTGLPDAVADGLCAVESACYSNGAGKQDFLTEAARLLKPGAPIVIIDGFLKRKEQGPVCTWLYRCWADSWAVAELADVDSFKAALAQAGFEEVEVTSLFWRIAPSALHIPFLATKFALAELWKARGRLSPWRRKHIIASYCAMFLGLFVRDFGYLMVTARKRGDA